MPYTPFHLGFGVFVFALCPYIDIFAILIGTIIIDIEGILYLLFKIGVPHGYMHSLLGVIVYLIPSSFFSWLCYKILQKGWNKQYKFNWLLSLVSSFLGLISHIFFDGTLYPEMMLLYPFTKKTGYLYGIWSYSAATITLTGMFFVGVVILLAKVILKYKYQKSILISYNFSIQTIAEKPAPSNQIELKL